MATPQKISTEKVGKEREFYTVTVRNEPYRIDVRYQNLRYVGGGAYGSVCSAYDSLGKRRVAIKKIRDTFRDLTDAKRILRELKLLRHLGGHENIIWILDIMVHPRRRDFEDVYIVTDLMETDLERIIKSPQPLSDSHIKYFVYQILRGLKYIHSASVLHRDLKPSNILVNSNCELVVCDFGLSRAAAHIRRDEYIDAEAPARGAADQLTMYVVTRWYRAPELLTASYPYDAAIDVWSVGCILAEILGRRPLFPGKDYRHQLKVIVEILGTPSEEDMAFITRRRALEDIRALGKRHRVPFSKRYPHANPQAVDLLEKMLHFNPAKRITVAEALKHPYLADYHDPSDEPDAPSTVTFDFDLISKLAKQDLQVRIIKEMEYFRPDFIRPHSTRLSSAAPKDRVAKPGIVASFGEVSSVPGKQVMQGQPTIQEGAAEGGQAAGGGGSTADMGLEEFEELTGGDDGEEEEHVELSRTAEEDKEAEEARKRAKAIRTRERGMAGLRQLEKAAEPSQPAAPQPSSSQAGAPDMSLLMQQMKSMFSEQMNQMSRMVDDKFQEFSSKLQQEVEEKVNRTLLPTRQKLERLERMLKGPK